MPINQKDKNRSKSTYRFVNGLFNLKKVSLRSLFKDHNAERRSQELMILLAIPKFTCIEELKDDESKPYLHTHSFWCIAKYHHDTSNTKK